MIAQATVGHVGLSAIVSVGNKADVDEAESSGIPDYSRENKSHI